MSEFLHAVSQYGFMQIALVTGVLASISCGMIGTYVVTKRITYMAGAIAHCVLGGMGVARYLQVVYGLEGIKPIYGAIEAAVVAAVIIGIVSLNAKERVDTIIGALWAVGMATGVIFISMTPGYGSELMSYLFGNILMVSSHDLSIIVGLDILVVAMGLIFFRQLEAICFDEEFAKLRGLNVEFYYLMLLILTALTVVLLVTVVGVIMVIALLTLPAAIAGRFSKGLREMMTLSVIISALLCTVGLGFSYSPNLPAGATIVVLAGIAYLVTIVGSGLVRRRRKRAS